MRFANSDRGEELAYLASRKRNWREYWLAQSPAGRSIAGHGAFRPLATRGGGYDDLAMEGIVVERVRHGTGMYRFPAGDARARGFYSGQWRHGDFHGIGTHISGTGRFQGHFRRGTPAGKGTQVSARGDVYRGDWGCAPRHTHASLMSGNEYCDGVPHGRGELSFVDGSVYRGEVRDGGPCGNGRYTLPTGDVAEGQFDGWGCMAGEGSSSADGVTLMGKWRRGFLHGPGTAIDTALGTYDGDFECSLKHGYGMHRFRLVEGTHVGGYTLGDRCGYGLLDYSQLSAEEEVKRGIRSADSLSFTAAAATGLAAPLSSPGSGPLPPPGGPPGSAPASPARKAPSGSAGWLQSPGLSPAKPSQAVASGAVMTATGVQSALQAKAALLANIPSSGEYRVEGRWRGGAMQAGGVLTNRSRAARGDALAYTFHLASDQSKKALPGLDILMRQEAAVLRDRQDRARAIARALRAQRRTRERINTAKFASFMRAADKAHEEIADQTAVARGYLGDLAASIEARRNRAELERQMLDMPEDDGSPKRPVPHGSEPADEEKKGGDDDDAAAVDEDDPGDDYYARLPSTGTGAAAPTSERLPTVAAAHRGAQPSRGASGSGGAARGATAARAASSAASSEGSPSSTATVARAQVSPLQSGASASARIVPGIGCERAVPAALRVSADAAAAAAAAAPAAATAGIIASTASSQRGVAVTIAESPLRPVTPPSRLGGRAIEPSVGMGMGMGHGYSSAVGVTVTAAAAAEITGVNTE